MVNRSKKVVRAIGATLASGWLLQAGTCAIDPTTLTQNLVALIAQNFISSIVFNAFNVPIGGGF